MLIQRAVPVLIATLMLALAPLQTSFARSQPVTVQQAQSSPLSLDEAATMVQRRVGGRVLSAEAKQSNGNTYYQIRVLVKKGQIKVYRVDPESGRIF